MPLNQLRRREFILLLWGTAVVWPLAARAQQPATPVIGWLSTGSPGSQEPDALRVNAFRLGLNETGFVEGRNVAFEYRWSEGHYERLLALAADLVDRRVAVIIAVTTPSALAAKAATSTIPIVFSIAADPVQVALVTSLNRPGGNITGIARLAVEVTAKRLEMLRALAPTTTLIAILVNPTNTLAAKYETKEALLAAHILGVHLLVLNAVSEIDIETAFATLVQQRAHALLVSADPLFANRRERLAALAIRHAVPTIYQSREFPAVGGLMSYGPSITDSDYMVGVYTGRILKGEKPGDLPVQQSTKVELVINLKTAKALGLTVPATLLARADEIIE